MSFSRKVYDFAGKQIERAYIVGVGAQFFSPTFFATPLTKRLPAAAPRPIIPANPAMGIGLAWNYADAICGLVACYQL